MGVIQAGTAKELEDVLDGKTPKAKGASTGAAAAAAPKGQTGAGDDNGFDDAADDNTPLAPVKAAANAAKAPPAAVGVPRKPLLPRPRRMTMPAAPKPRTQTRSSKA